MKNLSKILLASSMMLFATLTSNAQCNKAEKSCCKKEKKEKSCCQKKSENKKSCCLRDKSIYDFTAYELGTEKPVSLSEYNGKVLVIVNTASKCGLTPQYKGLEELYKKYKDSGLVIIGFPCNQFKGQEPGDAKQIKEECLLNYGVTFPMMSKVDVNGKNAIPLYKYLKRLMPNGNENGDIQWNFTKFVIDRNGKVVKRFEPREKPETMVSTIEMLLSKK